MKQIIIIIICSFVVGLFASIADAESFNLQKYDEIMVKGDRILKAAKARGYLNDEELKWNLSLIKQAGYCKSSEGAAFSVCASVVRQDLLPFKAMLYLSLEKEDYEQAENIRKEWLDYLNATLYLVRKNFKDEECEVMHIYKSIILPQIQKLKNPGLTDRIILRLRKDLDTALNNKQWADAKNIQDIITARMKELQPPETQQPQVIVMPGSGSQNVTIQQPATQHITVEQIPRYGATDIGRAISILDGKGGRLDPKAEGTLRLMDIFLKR